MSASVGSRPLLLGALFAICGLAVVAGPATASSQNILLAGEIILQPQEDSHSRGASKAAQQRSRADDYRQDSNTRDTKAEEEDGVLSPRGSSSTMDNASENRRRARAFQGGDVPRIPVPLTRMGEDAKDLEEPSTHDRATESLLRARRYSKSYQQSGLTGRVGKDGVPYVSCKDVGSVAGRIGDDELGSGSIITVIRDGKQIKARCE